MPAYVIVEIEVVDPVGYEEYKKRASDTVHQHGGKYIVRGGATEPLEGAAPNRVVVLEFASLAAARAFYTSQDYSEALEIRKAASRSRVFLVEGM